MATYILYVDVAGNQLVAGLTNPSVAPSPPLVQGDTLNLQVYLLARTPTYGTGVNPFTIISTAGLTLQLALGDKVGNATNYYATQFTWTTDPSNSYFTAALSLNTTPVTNLLGANASAPTTLHIEYLNAGLPTTVLEIPVTIQAAVIKAGGTGPLPPGQTPLSAELANSIFLTRNIVGQVVFVSPDGTKKMALYLDNDGSFHEDPLQ